jgi:hypothetical protein
MTSADMRTNCADTGPSSSRDRPRTTRALTCGTCPHADDADVADVRITSLTAAPTVVRRDDRPEGTPERAKETRPPDEVDRLIARTAGAAGLPVVFQDRVTLDRIAAIMRPGAERVVSQEVDSAA